MSGYEDRVPNQTGELLEQDTEPQQLAELEDLATVAGQTSEQTRVHFYLVRDTRNPEKRPLVLEHAIVDMNQVRMSRLELQALQASLGYHNKSFPPFQWQTETARFLAGMGTNNPSKPPIYMLLNDRGKEYVDIHFPADDGSKYHGEFVSINVYARESTKTAERIVYVTSPFIPKETGLFTDELYNLHYVDVYFRTGSEQFSEAAHRLWEGYISTGQSTLPSARCTIKPVDHQRLGIKNHFLRQK